MIWRLGSDAPADRSGWNADDALKLVESLHIGVEFAASPMAQINALGPTVVASDFGNNGGLILGPAIDGGLTREALYKALRPTSHPRFDTIARVCTALGVKLVAQPMQVSMIVAMAANRAIGKDNRMPWHLSSDLKRFKQLTMGHPIIMGRLTFEAIGKPLPSGPWQVVQSSR